MLDIRRIRDEPDLVRQRLEQRAAGLGATLDPVIRADSEWRERLGRVESLKAERNRLAKEVGGRKKKGESADDLMEQSKQIADQITAEDEACRRLDDEIRARLLTIPNVPHSSVPQGASADDNPVVATWGAAPELGFAPRAHVELGERLGILDFESARKVSGSGFVVYRKAGARLERALIQWLLDRHVAENGYEEVSPPFLIVRDSMVGTGQLPKFEEDMYGVQDGLFLAPTAEVPVTNLHRDELLKEGQLPIRYAAYTPCFRREAGSSGQETKGLIRMHQFDKVELVHVVKPETSYEALEALRRHAEGVLEALGLHYRTVLLCTGDMGFGAAKCYDLEVWAPGTGRFLEVSSCSNFEDFQARRMNLRFKDDTGKNRFCHTLNGSGTALARLVVALLETYQTEDGSVDLPEILAPYLGGKRRIEAGGALV